MKTIECPRNHPLKMRMTLKRREVTGINLFGLGSSINMGISCDNCKKKMFALTGYITCDQNCNFDLCSSCARCENKHILKTITDVG